MKKIKKIFKFIPSFALIILSGLLSVFSVNENLTPTSAANDYLVSERSVTNYDYTYTNNGVTFHYYFDLNFYLYNVLSNNTFYYVVNGRSYLGRNSVSYNGITYGNGYASSDYYVDFNLVSSSFIFGGNIADINIYFNGTLVNQSFSGFNDLSSLGGNYAWIWYVTQRIRINYGTSDLYLYYPKNLQSSSNALDYSLVVASSNTNNFPSVFTTGLVSSTSSRAIVSYTVDLTRSNYDLGYEEGYNAGYDTGFNNGYTSGVSNGTDIGYNNGYEAGYTAAIGDNQSSYDSGYAAGVAESGNQSAVANSIFDGIIRIGILPVQFFLSVFNFQVFGINVSVIITSLLAVAITVILIRFITGKKF